MSPDIPHNAIYHRLKDQFYSLKGTECPHCGKPSFPPKAICPHCDYEVKGTFVGMGTVDLSYSHSGNGGSPRQIELSVSLENKKLQVKISLIGKNHSLDLKAGMEVPVFVRKSLNGGSPLYTAEPNQAISEFLKVQESSKSSK